MIDFVAKVKTQRTTEVFRSIGVLRDEEGINLLIDAALDYNTHVKRAEADYRGRRAVRMVIMPMLIKQLPACQTD